MQVFTDRDTCESLIQTHDESILDAHYYKRLLNTCLQPDEYLFFEAGGHILPGVGRDGLVTFYGGTRHNAANRLPQSAELLNDALDYLVRRGYRFQLVSILNDVCPLLSEDLRRFAVPYTAEWHYRDIQHYSPDLLVQGRAGKKLWSWKRVFRNRASYTFETIDFEELRRRFDVLMRAHAGYFAARGKVSVWSGSESLLLQILTEFHRRHRLLIRLVSHAGEPRAIYAIVHNASEMIYYFGASLSPNDHYVSKVMYLDLLDQARAIAAASGIDSLNGLAGAFANKKVFGFSPRPLYAIVNDPAWIVRTDPDLDAGLGGHPCAP